MGFKIVKCIDTMCGNEVYKEHVFSEETKTVPNLCKTPRQLLERVQAGSLDLNVMERNLLNDDNDSDTYDPDELDLAYAGQVINENSTALERRKAEIAQKQKEFADAENATSVDKQNVEKNDNIEFE